MDVETASAIEQIHQRIDALEETLRTEIRLSADSVRSDVRIEFREGLDRLREEIREEIQEARRHAVVLNEETRGDIRLVAEGVAHLSVKLDSLKR